MSNSESASTGQAQPTAVFAPSPRPRLSAGSLLLIILCFVLVFGGFYMMGAAFTYEEIGIWLFSAGILVDALGFWIAFGILPNRDR